MKINHFFYLGFILLILNSCNVPKKQENNFLSSNDTLKVKTKKLKGIDIFPSGAGQVYFYDTDDYNKYPIEFPENINNIKIAYYIIDFKNFDPDAYHNRDIRNDKLLMKNSICIMSGQYGNDSIFIVDENNNKDFRDDSIRFYKKMNWYDTLSLIKCKYYIDNGVSLIEDSSWLNIGTLGNKNLLKFVSHHLEATLTIDNESFQIGLIDGNNGFTFDQPILAILSQKGTRKDTLPQKELIYKDEHLKINNTYYRFDTISNDGKYITLIKENDFNTIVGKQTGMLAPGFNCFTFDGDSINFNNLDWEKPVLIANFSRCTRASYDEFQKLNEIYGDSLNIIGLEYGISEDLGGILVDVGQPLNDDLFKKYRNNYSNYDCYLIDKNKRIANRFIIFDWKAALASMK